MPHLKGYNQFAGRHPETGPIHNALAYQGVTAPHTGQPYSEALLMGVSGGVAFGYFLFAYEDYDPHLALLTRNTFDPMQTMLERLGIIQINLQTASPTKGEENLRETLADGLPAIVWADRFTLPYNNLPHDDANWGMMPLVVFGIGNDLAYIADRSSQPLTIPASTLTAARARVKKDKFRLLTLEAPNPDKLVSAVQKGIWQCINLYTEKPPKGSTKNFGFKAYQHWAKMLTNTRNKQSWSRFFPAGSPLYQALAGTPEQPGAFAWIRTWWNGDGLADRALYADFLDEAAIILNKPTLDEAAKHFRTAANLWQSLSDAMLPDSVDLLHESREHLLQRHRLFCDQGQAAMDKIKSIDTRLHTIRETVTADFPMSDSEIMALFETLRGYVLDIHNIEHAAISAMQSAMA